MFLRKMLIPWPTIEILNFLGKPSPFVNYFVKTRADMYHKIVMPVQQWWVPHLTILDMKMQRLHVVMHYE
jgi:hypothetical protein